MGNPEVDCISGGFRDGYRLAIYRIIFSWFYKCSRKAPETYFPRFSLFVIWFPRTHSESCRRRRKVLSKPRAKRDPSSGARPNLSQSRRLDSNPWDSDIFSHSRWLDSVSRANVGIAIVMATEPELFTNLSELLGVLWKVNWEPWNAAAYFFNQSHTNIQKLRAKD